MSHTANLLVDRARQGDLEAFEALYRDQVGRIYAVCLRMSGDPVAAEELTQRAFVRAWEKLATFKGTSSFGTWMYRVAVNVVVEEARSASRRQRRDAQVLEIADRRVRRTGPERGMDLERAIADLPDGARRVFVLHDVEGWRHADIARLLGVTTGTTKSQLHRARRLLREALGR